MLVASRRAVVRLSAATNARTLATYPAHTVMMMPALSPTMTAGTIARWNKKEGDQINPGDSLADVDTDKATMSFDAQDEGFLAKILVKDGTSDVPVGSGVAIIVEDKSLVAAFKDFALESAPATPAPVAKPATAAAAPPPAAAAAPAPAPKAPVPVAAAAVAAPAPAARAAAAPAAASSDLPYLAFEAWGGSLARSPVAQAIAKQQNAYVAAFGYTGFDPIPVAEEKKKGGEEAAKGKKA